MIAEAMTKLKVLDIASGNLIGAVTGLLIDGDQKEVVALEIGGGWFSHPHYLPFASIASIENDVLTIASADLLVERGEFKVSRLLGNLDGRKVYTEDGKNLGTVHDYNVDIQTGEISAITVALDSFSMAGLVRSEGKSFGIPRYLIAALGENVVVDNAVSLKKGA